MEMPEKIYIHPEDPYMRWHPANKVNDQEAQECEMSVFIKASRHNELLEIAEELAATSISNWAVQRFKEWKERT